jgi:hypothetical protein
LEGNNSGCRPPGAFTPVSGEVRLPTCFHTILARSLAWSSDDEEIMVGLLPKFEEKFNQHVYRELIDVELFRTSESGHPEGGQQETTVPRFTTPPKTEKDFKDAQ